MEDAKRFYLIAGIKNFVLMFGVVAVAQTSIIPVIFKPFILVPLLVCFELKSFHEGWTRGEKASFMVFDKFLDELIKDTQKQMSVKTKK